MFQVNSCLVIQVNSHSYFSGGGDEGGDGLSDGVVMDLVTEVVMEVLAVVSI